MIVSNAELCDHCDQARHSSLYTACMQGNLDMVKYLYERGGDKLLMMVNKVIM